MCVDAMGKLMMAHHWSLEAGIIIGEQKANVKEGRDYPLHARSVIDLRLCPSETASELQG